jgi:Mrp family chromosome partitioning ATPase
MESGVSDKRELSSTIGTIEKVGGNVLGFILNCVDFKTDSAWLEKYGKSGRYINSYASAYKKAARGE